MFEIFMYAGEQFSNELPRRQPKLGMGMAGGMGVGVVVGVVCAVCMFFTFNKVLSVMFLW